MKIEKVRSKLKKVFNRVMGVLLPVATLFVSCGTNALVVRAADSSQTIHVISEYSFIEGNTEKVESYDYTLICADGYEIVAYYETSNTTLKILFFKVINKHSKDILLITDKSVTCSGKKLTYVNGKKQYDYDMPKQSIQPNYVFSGNGTDSRYRVTKFSLSGNIKVFKDFNAMKSYITSGDTSGMIEVKDPENEKNWYLKNVNGYVTADDSPSSEAGADATYIHFTWDTDNLQEGDLIEIKTNNYYKKIGGEKLSGFHDFITYSDGVSATNGEYSFSQYLPAKAWFNSLENKPLMFKEYDTTDYYIRPVRMGALGVEKYGGWIHIGMGKRTTPTSSPWADSDNSGEYGDFNEDGDWIIDEETTEKEGGRHGWLQDGTVLTPEDKTNPFTGTNLAGMFSYFFDFMKGIPSLLGDLPALVSSIIGFLPVQIIGFIGLGILVAIILRIVGR